MQSQVNTLPELTEIQELFSNQLQTAIQWRQSTAEERSARLKNLRTWIKDHQLEIRKCLWLDFKKPEAEVDLSEIFPVTSEINHALKNLGSWMKPKSVSTPLPMLGTNAKIYFEPKGTALILAPWNFPFNLTIGPLVSALAAGCPTIIKPSEMSPHTSNLISGMIKELFDPKEVAVFTGEVELATSLLKLPFDHIFFTGSPQVGKVVMKAAAEHLTSVTLELGGKSPALIDDTADLNDAAGKIIWGKFVNCGQTCIAPDYILVPETHKERLVMEMKVFLQKFYDPFYKGISHSGDYARIINKRHFTRIKNLLTDAIEKGATLEFGGNFEESDLFFEPTILSGITSEMGVIQEEIFGPILPIVTYKSLEEAIDLINSKPKPLALYYFGKNPATSKKVQKETSSGNAVINDCVLHFLHNELPFGGVNNSGIGKSHGHYGFLAFSNEKGVLKQRVGYNNVTLLRPPYGIKAKQLIASLIKWF
ncbi:aldehyde dehydrogenase family protein [Algoriphagus sp. A40]|uniref:aldehyde dehydrogenase family protein n=1 Tax=Algoriphagus sp. A40 TaxID=1945863 RepID=UPI000984F76B|nr:aldehyde dehydrogenase family protein [Algoriphagus sp. A40]OOG68075.1 aldehyde dehydrogenase family protein [Algoriphagus sp. A40]